MSQLASHPVRLLHVASVTGDPSIIAGSRTRAFLQSDGGRRLCLSSLLNARSVPATGRAGFRGHLWPGLGLGSPLSSCPASEVARTSATEFGVGWARDSL